MNSNGKSQIPTTWMGYRRPDGQAGSRNFLLMLSGTLYANAVCERVSDMVVNTIPVVHPLGRCQVMPDLRLTYRTLVGMGKNPNCGAVIVVDHHKETGCTADEIAHEIAKTGKPVEAINIRASGGVIEATMRALRMALEFQRKISAQEREELPVSDLVFGMNCGTSDTTSGISSNKAVGVVSDLIIDQGGRSIMAETTEMLGGEDVLVARAATKEIGEKIWFITKRMERRALESGEDIRGSQPTGDNILGGLSSIEEKSLGAIQKSGTKPIVGVVDFAETIDKTPGLYIMDTPGHGGESITGIAAAGSQVLTFSTGGGHTINHPVMTTIRLTGNRISYEKMKDTVEVDVSDIFDGTPIQDAGMRLYKEVIETVSGKLTKCEILKENNAMAIHRIGISI
ncbi:MAG: UxaA family hydrolase [Acidobacteriaceae bacterium]|nr:UxaA family hydrolase [Acidobacteriaceae bacterium]